MVAAIGRINRNITLLRYKVDLGSRYHVMNHAHLSGIREMLVKHNPALIQKIKK